MAGMTCDKCDAPITVNTRVVIRLPRPSDPTDLCGVLWDCADCSPPQNVADFVGDDCERVPSQMYERDWDTYIESPAAMRHGFLFLT